jgi:aspartate kinase
MIVMKFGGGTLATRERMERCIALVEADTDRRPVVVVSAHGKTTDGLLEAAGRALAGAHESAILDEVRALHLGLAAAYGVEATVLELLEQLEALLQGVALLRELTPRTLDRVLSFGERLSSTIFAAGLRARGLPGVAVTAYDAGMVTDSNFGGAAPLPEAEGRLREGIGRIDGLPVVTGFLGKNPQGEITTLGRSGSDFTATYVAAAIGAEEVVVWKDVDGVMTADPGLDDRALNIPELSFDEASELAYFGAEVLHPATLLPAIHKKIPVRVVNAFKAEEPGTVVLSHPVHSGRIAKSVVYKEDVTLLHLISPRLHSVPHVLGAALNVLEEEGIIAHMIATSEAGISLITQSGLSGERRDTALRRLGALAAVECLPSMAIICLVGEELRGCADPVGRVFDSLAAAGINGKVITRSASEINLAFLVEEAEIGPAVRSLHSLIVEGAR